MFGKKKNTKKIRQQWKGGCSKFCDCLVGLVVKASASRVEDPEFESRLGRDCFRVESYQRLKNQPTHKQVNSVGDMHNVSIVRKQGRGDEKWVRGWRGRGGERGGGNMQNYGCFKKRATSLP